MHIERDYYFRARKDMLASKRELNLEDYMDAARQREIKGEIRKLFSRLDREKQEQYEAETTKARAKFNLHVLRALQFAEETNMDIVARIEGCLGIIVLQGIYFLHSAVFNPEITDILCSLITNASDLCFQTAEKYGDTLLELKFYFTV